MSSVIVYWDGKLMHFLDSKDHVNCFQEILAGKGESKILSGAKIIMEREFLRHMPFLVRY